MQDLISALSKATAHWLAYKKFSGFNTACEALLIIPIAECLAARGYTLKSEQDTSFLKIGSPGEFNYDVIAERRDNGTTIFLETKYYPKKQRLNEARLYIDLLKLALPTDAQCPQDKFHRMLLMAGKDLSTSDVIKKLRNKNEIRVEELPNSKELGAFVNKITNLGWSPNRCTVKHSPEAVADGETVEVFSVVRS
jgi:hypothetical protein